MGLLMTAALRKGPGEGIAEMDSKHNQLKEPIATGEFPQILYEKLKKMVLEKMLSIPNYYRRKDNQNNNMKPNPTGQNGHPPKPTNSKCGRGPGAD